MSTSNYSPAIIAQTTIQMLASALSAICSTMLAVMILRVNSNRSSSAPTSGTGCNRLSTPYKRYLLGMCVADICQSLALLTGPFMVPKEMNYVVGLAGGNMTTCNINGFFFTFGVACNLFYLSALMLSYLSKIKYNMPNQVFLNKYDKVIHVVALGYTCFCCTFLIVSESINSADRAGFCYILQSPNGCSSDCRGYENRMYAFLLFYICDILLVLAIMVSMYMIVHHVIVTDQISASRGTEADHEILDATSDEQTSTVTNANKFQRLRKWLLSYITGPCKFIAYLRTNEDSVPVDIYPDYGQNHSDQIDPPTSIRRARLARMNRKLATTSALLFTISMVLIYFIPFLVSIMQLVGEGKEVPTAMVLIQFFLFPLGGVMFIFSHTWHKIKTVRQENTRYSWIRAFVAVIMAGGELPPPPPTVDDDRTRNERIPSILLEGNHSALKWYDIIGHWKLRLETARVKKRFKKRPGSQIRRRASDLSVSDGVVKISSSPQNDDSSIDDRSKSKSNVDVDDSSKDDDFQKVRLLKWLKNSITRKTLEMTAADIHKRYTIDVMSGASDESD